MNDEEMQVRIDALCFEHRDCNPNGDTMKLALHKLLSEVRDKRCDQWEEAIANCDNACAERDELRAEVERLKASPPFASDLHRQVVQLRARLDESRAEVARLQHKVDDLERTAQCAEDMRDASDAEVERLRGQKSIALEAISRLGAEIAEARNEAATVRRAYLHERWRADAACGALARHDRVAAEELAEEAYQGSAVEGRSAHPSAEESK